jgi:hypothetical protein
VSRRMCERALLLPASTPLRSSTELKLVEPC